MSLDITKMPSRAAQLLAGLPIYLALLSITEAAQCNSTDLPAQCCYNAWTEWRSSKEVFESPTSTVVPYTEKITYYDTDLPYTTTLCDGFKRALVPETTTTVTLTDSPSITKWISETYPTPSPDCTINETDCIPFMANYKASLTAWSSNESLPYPTEPPCQTYTTCPGADGGTCKILVAYGGVRVFYWPVTVESDLCGERTTITHPEPSRSTIISGTTFISPSIYLSISRLTAASYQGKNTASHCGHDQSDIVLTMHPTDVSTHYGTIQRLTQHFRQIDLADLNTPVPGTAYFSLTSSVDCNDVNTAMPEECNSIIPFGVPFQPIMSAPVQMFRDLEGDYAYCDLHPSSRSRLNVDAWIPLETPTMVITSDLGTSTGSVDED